MLKLILLLALYATAGYWIWQGLYWLGTNEPWVLMVAAFFGTWVAVAKWGDVKLAEW